MFVGNEAILEVIAKAATHRLLGWRTFVLKCNKTNYDCLRDSQPHPREGYVQVWFLTVSARRDIFGRNIFGRMIFGRMIFDFINKTD